MLPIPPRDESKHQHRSPEPPDTGPKLTRNQLQARWGCVLPLFAWFSELFRFGLGLKLPAEGYLVMAFVQLILTIAGMMLSSSALARRRPGETGVRAPAIFGLLVSLGTFALLVATAFRAMQH